MKQINHHIIKLIYPGTLTTKVTKEEQKQYKLIDFLVEFRVLLNASLSVQKSITRQ